jgi:hypothetical protein
VYNQQADRNVIRDNARDPDADGECRAYSEQLDKADWEVDRPGALWSLSSTRATMRVCHVASVIRQPVQTDCPVTAITRVIESQSVGLSANFLRPERRSDDGRVILKVP